MDEQVERAKARAKEVVSALSKIPELENIQSENLSAITAAEEVTVDKDEDEAKFVVNVGRRSWKTGPVATLHSRTGCWRGRDLSFNNYELIMGDVPDKSAYELVCRRCWPAGPPQFTLTGTDAVAEGTEETSSSSSSSSS